MWLDVVHRHSAGLAANGEAVSQEVYLRAAEQAFVGDDDEPIAL
jgi:hypothetical protein